MKKQDVKIKELKMIVEIKTLWFYPQGKRLLANLGYVCRNQM